MEGKQPFMEILEFTICLYLHFNKKAILMYIKIEVYGQMYTVSRALEEFFGQCEPDRGEFTFTVLHFPVSIIVVFISIFNFYSKLPLS